MLTSRKGFTVVEVMVVVVVIAALAGIIFPVFGLVEEKAHQTTCLSNIRQIQQALSMYATDYDQTHARPTAGWGKEWWMREIFPHVKDTRVFLCPSDSKPTYAKYGGPVEYTSYGPNGCLWQTQELGPPKAADVQYPSEMFELTETEDILGMLYMSGFKANHGGGANFGFMDGHVKWLSEGQVPVLRATPPPDPDGPAVWRFWYGQDPPRQ